MYTYVQLAMHQYGQADRQRQTGLRCSASGLMTRCFSDPSCAGRTRNSKQYQLQTPCRIPPQIEYRKNSREAMDLALARRSPSSQGFPRQAGAVRMQVAAARSQAPQSKNGGGVSEIVVSWGARSGNQPSRTLHLRML